MTTKDIIKMLPFKAEFKEDLLNRYDSFTPDQRFSIERIVWGYYYAVYQARLDKNMQAAFQRAGNNEEALDKEFYERVRKQTDMELQEVYNEETTDVNLSTARGELEEIIKQSN